MSGFEWVDDSDLEDNVVMDTDKEPAWSTQLESATNGDSETIYDPRRMTTAWMTVSDNIWEDIDE